MAPEVKVSVRASAPKECLEGWRLRISRWVPAEVDHSLSSIVYWLRAWRARAIGFQPCAVDLLRLGHLGDRSLGEGEGEGEGGGEG